MRDLRPRLWAPRPERVDLVVGDAGHPMEGAEDGCRTASVELAPGTDYAFSLDGGEPRPDPRSPWQPHGVHGPSRTVDHEAFGWTDAGWSAPPLADAIVYELHVGTFTPAEVTVDGKVRLAWPADLASDSGRVLPPDGIVIAVR